jgi:mannose-6-phosphate isomerase-like protein (cupin superfamily)
MTRLRKTFELNSHFFCGKTTFKGPYVSDAIRWAGIKPGERRQNEAEPGCWKIRYTENEFCPILNGRSILRDASGRESILEAGDNFVIPAGSEGE